MSQDPRLLSRTIDYVEDIVGADVPRDVIKVAITEQDLDTVDVRAAPGVPVDTDLDSINGTALTPSDWTKLFQDMSKLYNALEGGGNSDQLRVSSPSPLDVSASTVPTEQQTPVGVEDSSGTQKDPIGTGDQPLDVSSAEVDVDLNSQTLGSVSVDDSGNFAISAYNGGNIPTEQQTPIGIEDESGTQVNLKDSDEVYASGESLSSGGTNTYSVIALGGRSVNGQIKSSGGYDLEVRWQDDAGTTIRTESIASGVAGGTWTDINLNPKSANAVIAITDTSSASQTVDATVHYN